jgi:hypothetical protein
MYKIKIVNDNSKKSRIKFYQDRIKELDNLILDQLKVINNTRSIIIKIDNEIRNLKR